MCLSWVGEGGLHWCSTVGGKSTRRDLRNDAGFGGMSGAEGMQGTRDGERML